MANKSIFDQLTIIIIAKNEERMLARCLENLACFPHLLVIDNASDDQTAKVAREFKARVMTVTDKNLSQLREFGAKKAATDWIFYLDADERLTPKLADKIFDCMIDGQSVAATCLRENYFYGHKFTAGGWENDRVTRLFRRSALDGWQGKIHETPIYHGLTTDLGAPLWHFTHRNTSENLVKSAAWTKMEADLLAQSPQTKIITKMMILRKGGMEFYRRYWRDHGYRDGMAGFVESLVQGINKMLIYIQIWEEQLHPSLIERYDELENKIAQDWQKKNQSLGKSP